MSLRTGSQTARAQKRLIPLNALHTATITMYYVGGENERSDDEMDIVSRGKSVNSEKLRLCGSSPTCKAHPNQSGIRLAATVPRYLDNTRVRIASSSPLRLDVLGPMLNKRNHKIEDWISAYVPLYHRNAALRSEGSTSCTRPLYTRPYACNTLNESPRTVHQTTQAEVETTAAFDAHNAQAFTQEASVCIVQGVAPHVIVILNS